MNTTDTPTIIQIINSGSHLHGLGSDGAVYCCNGEKWLLVIPPLDRRYVADELGNVKTQLLTPADYLAEYIDGLTKRGAPRRFDIRKHETAWGAWLAGRKIERKDENGEWVDDTADPNFHTNSEYRVKF